MVMAFPAFELSIKPTFFNVKAQHHMINVVQTNLSIYLHLSQM